MLAGITVGNFAFWADSLLVAVLLHYGASSFKRVTEVKCSNQLPNIFQVPLHPASFCDFTIGYAFVPRGGFRCQRL